MKRTMSVDHVTWVRIGANRPPDARRWAANTLPMTPDATTSAGLRVAQVVSMYTAVDAAAGWGDPSAVNKDPRKKTSSATRWQASSPAPKNPSRARRN